MILLARIRTVLILCVKLRLERNACGSGLESFFGNVEPHAESCSLHTVCNVTENDSVTGIKEYVIRPACKRSVGIIKSPCKCIITVSYLTAVGERRNEGLTAEILVKLTCKRLGANESIVYTFVLRPLFCFLEAHEACLIAVLEIPNNLGSLTELDSVCKCCCTVSNGYVNPCDRGIGCSGKGKAVKSTCRRVGKRYGNSISVNIYVSLACHSNNGKLDCTNLIGSRIRNYGGSCRKLKYRGVSYGDSLGANNLAAGKNLNINGACSSVRNKLTVCNGAEGSIGKHPNSICGHIHSVTVGIDSFCAEGVNSLGSKNIVLRLDVYVVENTGGRNVGCNENTMCGRTLCAVTRNRTHCEFLFTYTLGKEGGGSAAVAVSRPLTTESKHNFAFFVRRETYGIVSATAVVHTNDEGTVFLNADHRTSCIIVASLYGFANQFTVFYNHTEGYTYCVEKGSFCKVSVKINLVKRLNVTRDVTFRILKYVKDGGGGVKNSSSGSYVFAEVTDALTVVNKNTGRVGVVVKVSVHTADYVVSEIILVILCHFGKLLMRPVCLILEILIDLIVSGNNGNIGIGGVYFNNMKNLSAGTV